MLFKFYSFTEMLHVEISDHSKYKIQVYEFHYEGDWKGSTRTGVIIDPSSACLQSKFSTL